MDYKLKQIFKVKADILVLDYRLSIGDTNKLLATMRRVFSENRYKSSEHMQHLIDTYQTSSAAVNELDYDTKAHLEACAFAVRQALKVAKAREEATRTAELV